MILQKVLPRVLSSELRVKNAFRQQSRPFFQRFLAHSLNQVDQARVKEHGAERVCAEWALRVGAQVRFAEMQYPITDYLNLPPETQSAKYHLAELDAAGATLSGLGCVHFEGVSRLQRLVLDNCALMDDFGCEKVAGNLGHCLHDLVLTRCPKVTDKGLQHLAQLRSLKTLRVGDLKGVKDLEASASQLQQQLKDCRVDVSPN